MREFASMMFQIARVVLGAMILASGVYIICFALFVIK